MAWIPALAFLVGVHALFVDFRVFAKIDKWLKNQQNIFIKWSLLAVYVVSVLVYMITVTIGFSKLLVGIFDLYDHLAWFVIFGIDLLLFLLAFYIFALGFSELDKKDISKKD